MDKEIIGIIGLACLFLLLVARMPVALAMVTVGISGNYALSHSLEYLRFEPYIKQFKTLLWGTVTNYELSVLPLFILMGFLAGYSKLSQDLFSGLNVLVGRIRGGTAIAAIAACASFGAVCGSSLATASTMGKVALPELKRLNYADSLATGTLAAGGTLGILIPPSIALVLYAIIVEASIIDMFRAAIVPGLLAVVLFVVVIAVQVRFAPHMAPIAPSLASRQRRRDIMRLVPVLAIFGTIIVGLGIGVFTPTPAAAVGASLILLYGLALRRFDATRGLDLSLVRLALLDTAVISAMIYFILFAGEVLKGFFARAGLPTFIAGAMSNSGIDPWLIFLLLLLGLIVLGCFMDSLAMIVVVVPFIWPALVALNGGESVVAGEAGYGLTNDELKIWFGIIALVVVELGLITPPVGLNVFIIASIAKGVSMGTIFRGVAPFFAVEIVRVAILVAFPILCLLLPRML